MKYEDVMKQKKGFRIERVDMAKGELVIAVSDDWIDTVCSAVEKQIPQKVKEYADKRSGMIAIKRHNAVRKYGELFLEKEVKRND